METKRFKPRFDKLYWFISVPTLLFVLAVVAVSCVFEPKMLWWTMPVMLFVTYFLASPFFGYVELRENFLFIKYGLILKKEISYRKIRKIECKKSYIAESMMSLKGAVDHVEIRYNRFDLTIVSVKEQEAFVEELKERIKKSFGAS